MNSRQYFNDVSVKTTAPAISVAVCCLCRKGACLSLRRRLERSARDANETCGRRTVNPDNLGCTAGVHHETELAGRECRKDESTERTNELSNDRDETIKNLTNRRIG